MFGMSVLQTVSGNVVGVGATDATPLMPSKAPLWTAVVKGPVMASTDCALLEWTWQGRRHALAFDVPYEKETLQTLNPSSTMTLICWNGRGRDLGTSVKKWSNTEETMPSSQRIEQRRCERKFESRSIG